MYLFVSSEQTSCFARQMAEHRFEPAKTSKEEETCVASVIPKSTQYKKKWVAGVFE